MSIKIYPTNHKHKYKDRCALFVLESAFILTAWDVQSLAEEWEKGDKCKSPTHMRSWDLWWWTNFMDEWFIALW